MHFLHVDGNIMIQQGTGGFSRGDIFEGVLKKESMLSSVALQKGAIEVSPPIPE